MRTASIVVFGLWIISVSACSGSNETSASSAGGLFSSTAAGTTTGAASTTFETTALTTSLGSSSGSSSHESSSNASEGSTSSSEGEIFQLTSTAFNEGEPIPSVPYTCNGGSYPDGSSPPLSWSSPPVGTQSFALLLDDTTLNWVHWVTYDIPPTTTESIEGENPAGATIGVDSADFMQYAGPCPPQGTGNYRFRVLALDDTLGLEPGATMAEVEQAAQSHILGVATLTGTVSESDL